MPAAPRDTLVLTLLRHELRLGLRTLSWSALAWIVLGGGLLLAYGIADIVVALLAGADALRQKPAFWGVTLPAALAFLGLLLGLVTARSTLNRAFAPFSRALPLSPSDRRRMANRAAWTIGAPLAVLVGALASLACVLIAKSGALASGLRVGLAFAAGFAIAIVWRVSFGRRGDLVYPSAAGPERKGLPLFGLGRLDRSGSAWIGSWAWGLRAGRLGLTLRLLGTAMALALGAFLSVGASLARHEAAPAAVAGFAGGLAVFMLSLRFHPLGSPVLRAAPLSFARAWLRLLRLPILLSGAFFALPASAALAAEPSAWAMPLQSGLGLLVLNATYAVFAAYFMTAPLLSALAFFAALAYAQYESLEFGAAVLIGLAALVALLWQRSRARYYRG